MTEILVKTTHDQMLEQLGLKPEQFEGMQHAAIEKLDDQERVLKQSVEKMAKQTEELYLKRQSHAQAAEQMKIEMQENEKKYAVKLGEFQRLEQKLKDREQTVIIREDKLRVDKEALGKERSIYGNEKKNIVDELEKVRFENAQLNTRKKDLDLQADGIADDRYKLEKDMDKLNKAKESNEGLARENAAERAALNNDKKAFEDEKKIFEETIFSERAKLNADKKAHDEATENHKLESGNLYDSLQKRQLDIVRKEKEVKSQETDIKARLEALEIKEAGTVETVSEKPKEKKVKKQG